MPACQQCINDCCHRWCLDELVCALDCCGCCHIPILMGPNEDWHSGQIIAKKDSDLRYYKFDPFATDGTQVPIGLAMYTVTSDENGFAQTRYFNGLVPGADCGQPYTNMYVCGIFYTQYLRGDVGAARAAGLLRTLEGNDQTGLVKLV